MKNLFITLSFALLLIISAVWYFSRTWGLQLGAPSTGSFYFTNLLRFSTTTTGCLNAKTTASGVATAYFTGSDCGSGSGGGGADFPNVQAWGNSTSTTLGFLNGFLSTASSTINNNFYLSSLSQGFAYVGSSGKVNTAATSTILSGYVPYTGATTDVDLGIRQLIIGAEGTNASISSPNAITPNTDGPGIDFGAGGGTGTGAGGTFTMSAGFGGATGSGGNFNFTAGNGGATSGNGGNINLTPGTVTNGIPGKVGIATTTPNFILSSFSASAPQLSLSTGEGLAQWTLRNAGGNLYFSTTTVQGLATTSTSALTILGASGNTGISSTTPWKTFSVTGTGAWTGLTAAGATSNSVCLNPTTKEVLENAASSCLVSSMRFKHDIRPLDLGLDALMRLEPRQYKSNDTGEARIGFIAEEVDVIDSRLVDYDTEGNPLSVRYQEMVAWAVNAIKQLVNWNNDQDARITELEKEVAELKTLINNDEK